MQNAATIEYFLDLMSLNHSSPITFVLVHVEKIEKNFKNTY